MEIEDRVANKNIFVHLPYWPACQTLPAIGDLHSSAGEIMNNCVLCLLTKMSQTVKRIVHAGILNTPRF